MEKGVTVDSGFDDAFEDDPWKDAPTQAKQAAAVGVAAATGFALSLKPSPSTDKSKKKKKKKLKKEKSKRRLQPKGGEEASPNSTGVDEDWAAFDADDQPGQAPPPVAIPPPKSAPLPKSKSKTGLEENPWGFPPLEVQPETTEGVPDSNDVFFGLPIPDRSSKPPPPAAPQSNSAFTEGSTASKKSADPFDEMAAPTPSTHHALPPPFPSSTAASSSAAGSSTSRSGSQNALAAPSSRSTASNPFDEIDSGVAPSASQEFDPFEDDDDDDEPFPQAADPGGAFSSGGRSVAPSDSFDQFGASEPFSDWSSPPPSKPSKAVSKPVAADPFGEPASPTSNDDWAVFDVSSIVGVLVSWEWTPWFMKFYFSISPPA